MNKQTAEALRMAIAFMETLNIDIGIKTWNEKHRKEVINAGKAALQEDALDRMAENAKELGLDYCSHDSDSACKECYMEKIK